MFKTWHRDVLAGFTLFFMIAAGFTQPVLARPELGPPSIKLRSNVSNVVVAELVAAPAEGKLQFKTVQDLHNEAPDDFTIDLDPYWSRGLAIGRNYIVAYVEWRAETFPRTISQRAEGPVLVSLPGATPGIFADSALLRRMLSWDLDELGTSPESLLPLIREGLASTDWQYQEFFITEIVTRPKLHDKLTAADRAFIAHVAADPATSPYVPQLLFYNGDFLGTEYSPQQRVEVARAVLQQQPLKQDITSQYPALLRTAMHYLRENGSMDDGALLARWLNSDQPGLVEGAMEAMRLLGVEQLPELIDDALEHTFVSAEIRQVLQNYRRRLEAIRQQGG